MKEQIIQVQVPAGKRAMWVDNVLTLVNEVPAQKEIDRVFDKNLPITERVKTVEDAVKILGTGHPLVAEYELIHSCSGINVISKDIFAYLKLRIVAAALNEGWTPQFTEDEYRHFPWFVLYTQKEIDQMSEADRSRVVLRSNSSASATGGVAYASASYDSSVAYAGYGSRLAFRTSELSEYAGKQFLDIWADFAFKCEESSAKNTCYISGSK